MQARAVACIAKPGRRKITGRGSRRARARERLKASEKQARADATERIRLHDELQHAKIEALDAAYELKTALAVNEELRERIKGFVDRSQVPIPRWSEVQPVPTHSLRTKAKEQDPVVFKFPRSRAAGQGRKSYVNRERFSCRANADEWLESDEEGRHSGG